MERLLTVTDNERRLGRCNYRSEVAFLPNIGFW